MKTFTIGKKKIVLKEEWMVGFITTWIVGLLAHAYRFFNFLPIWDSIYNFTGVGSTYTLGRWFLGYAGLITSMFDLPCINGAFSLFYISIVVILLTEMFEIKNKGMIVLCAAIFVSFPTVVSSFAYMYTADAYLLAFLLATLAVYLTCQKVGNDSRNGLSCICNGDLSGICNGGNRVGIALYYPAVCH